MEISASYVVLVIGAGLAVVFLLQNVRMALRFLLTVAKLFAILFVLALFGWLVGWWDLPRPAAIVLYGLSRLWGPLKNYVMDWLQGCLP